MKSNRFLFLPLFYYFLRSFKQNVIYCMKTRKKPRHRDKKNVFTMNSEGLVIIVRNNTFIDSK